MGFKLRYLKLGTCSCFKTEKKYVKIMIYGAKLRLRPYLSILILVRLQNNLSGELPGALWGYSLQCGVRFLLTLSLNAAFSFSLTSGCL